MTIVATAGEKLKTTARRAPASAPAIACLLRVDPLGAVPGLVPLNERVIRIGSSSLCEVVLHGDGVAPVQAEIECLDGECWIKDCSCELGTTINGKPVSRHRLMPGDRIRLGRHVFKYLSADRFESQYLAAVYEMVTVDGLTGAQQRRHFDDAFAREVLRAQRHWRPIALLMFEIDDFDSVCQELGRTAADECLSAFSKRISSRILGEDLFARFGEVQFALSISEAPLKQSVRIAQDLRRLVEAEPFLTSQGPVKLTISIGVGFANGQGPVTAREIIKQARENLAKAKSAGRNCVLY